VIVPDNIINVLPETRALLSELKKNSGDPEQLSAYSKALLKSLPDFMIGELTATKNVDIQQIETERMLAELVGAELKNRSSYTGKFSPVCQFLGYQTRGSLPSVFDSNYGYALGGGLAVLLRENKNGYLCSAANLRSDDQTVFGVPLTAMLEVRLEENDLPEAAIFCQTVDLHGKHYQEWKRISATLEENELYENPGPLQYEGECAHLLTKLIAGEEGRGKVSYLAELAALRENASVLLEKLRPGVPAKKLRIANSSLQTLRNVLEEL